MPLTSVGGALVIGAILVTLVRGYIELAQDASSADLAEPLPESGREFAVSTLMSVSSSAGAATVAFWIGVGLVIVGTIRNLGWLLRIGRGR